MHDHNAEEDPQAGATAASSPEIDYDELIQVSHNKKDRLRIWWTRHAIERVAERFGFTDAIEIPNQRIINAGKLVDVGQDFRIETFLVTYVCKRIDDETVFILTVIYS